MMENICRTVLESARPKGKSSGFVLAVILATLSAVPAFAQISNLRLASTLVSQPSDNLVAFTVSEFSQGVDLNGDGDTLDHVVHVYDATTGITTNLGLASDGIAQVSGNLVAFTVSESAQGNTNSNCDADNSK